mmetsp:Transcript_3380/g.4313  ORF Transcript_3380/g.4313 Transcript_3380/m.4313 type:complete len:279 (-) Transcript_3380:53-889(-)
MLRSSHMHREDSGVSLHAENAVLAVDDILVTITRIEGEGVVLVLGRLPPVAPIVHHCHFAHVDLRLNDGAIVRVRAELRLRHVGAPVEVDGAAAPAVAPGPEARRQDLLGNVRARHVVQCHRAWGLDIGRLPRGCRVRAETLAAQVEGGPAGARPCEHAAPRAVPVKVRGARRALAVPVVRRAAAQHGLRRVASELGDRRGVRGLRPALEEVAGTLGVRWRRVRSHGLGDAVRRIVGLVLACASQAAWLGQGQVQGQRQHCHARKNRHRGSQGGQGKG